LRSAAPAADFEALGDSFALRAEIADSGVTVTCLMPGATEMS
jgi:hypothetical protein